MDRASSLTRFRIPDMDCATEEQTIRNRLKTVQGIDRLDFNLLERELAVTHRLADPAPIQQAIVSVGLRAELLNEDTAALPERGSVLMQFAIPSTLAVSGLLALGAEAAAWAGGDARSLAVAVLALGSVALGGRKVLRKGLGAVRARTLNINLLMSIAVAGAIVIGHWPEAAMVTFLFALAEEIEGRALDGARNAIHGLMAMAPDVATMQTGSGEWQQVPSSQVRVGALIRVRPGERVPLDGVVVSGRSAVNQAPITGESLPVDKGTGDPVFAGTINQDGSLEVRVSAAAGQTTLARIAHSIQEAQGKRAPTQRVVDQFARYYTPAVVVAAILTAALSPLLLAVPVYDAVYRALVLLVVACPCALVLSTPVTVVSGLTAASRRGILIKGGAYLEEGRRIKVVAIDKTGTLTHGVPKVTDIVPLDSLASLPALRLAASLNAHSTHPIARAVVDQWTEHAAQQALLTTNDARSLPGMGVTGSIDGEAYFVGSHRLAEEMGVCSSAVEIELEKLERAGKTTVVLGSATAVLAVLGVSDTLRSTSAEAVQALHAQQVHTVMLTGDNDVTAQVVAGSVGIEDVRANMLPADKLAVVEELRRRYGPIGMVGDGVNDAPAMAASTIGFAMGAAGSDTAIETADVAFMDDDLRKLPEFMHLSRRTRAILAQNIALSIGIKAAFLVWTFTGGATLWMAVFADMGTSLLVVFNGLRLLNSNSPTD